MRVTEERTRGPVFAKASPRQARGHEDAAKTMVVIPRTLSHANGVIKKVSIMEGCPLKWITTSPQLSQGSS